MCPTVRILLWVVAGSLAYLLIVLLRRADRGQIPFALLAGANFLLAVFALSTDPCGLPGWLAMFVFAMVVIVPALLRSLEMRAAAADRLRLASALASLRSILQPGTHATRDHALRRGLLAIRSGAAAGAAHFDAIRAEIARATDPFARAQLREQLILLLVFDRRFGEAVEQWDREPIAVETRPSLGAAMVRALCELGRMQEAAAVLARLENGPVALDAFATPVLNQARLVFLAFSGQARAVADLLEKSSNFLPALPPPTRAFWIGQAALHAGQVAPARAAFEKARELALGQSDRRVLALAEEGLLRTEQPPAPVEIHPAHRALLETVAERARQARALPGLRVGWRDLPATLGLAAINIAIYVAGVFAVGTSPSDWTIVRWGANFHPAVRGGETFRLVSSMFLHGGGLHIVSNMYVLLLLGRLVEPFFGTRRFLGIYMIAGVCGSIASVLGGRGILSVGASGAIMGMMGALIPLTLARRSRLPATWRRTLLTNLLILVGIQVIMDWRVELIDNYAHLGGLCGGIVAGAVFLPSPGRVRDFAAVAIALALAVWGGIGVARADSAQTALHFPRSERRIDDVSFRAPSYWELRKDQFFDPLGLDFSVDRFRIDEDPVAGIRRELEARFARQQIPAHREAAPHLAPPSWSELAYSYPGADKQTVLGLWLLHPEGDEVVLVHITLLSDDYLPTYAPLLRELLASVRT